MKLTDISKKLNEGTNSKQRAKSIIISGYSTLTDDELEKVTGGQERYWFGCSICGKPVGTCDCASTGRQNTDNL